ncbi:MAG: molybdopterin molybdenumtransferase MoeA, partial [Lachnospiraceae bacterium]|nr:molybdopterin molybdenumtransferase MoeA [Lachnospiraceae bacterium]
MEIEECLDKILGKIEPGQTAESVRLEDGICGRILAEDVVATRNVPAFPRSAMDGYAVHSEDVAEAAKEAPAVLKVQGELC